jgi:cell division septal protein FtsQ
MFVPAGLLHQIKFRRRPFSFETAEERAARHLFITILVIAGLLAAVLTFLILQLK